MIPIFERFPDLQSHFPHIQLCELPTPVEPLKKFGRYLDHPNLYIKRDDLSGKLFGGNKVRSLEFLLASAQKQENNFVIGLPGTSMALAANIYAHMLNIPLNTVLVEQNPTLESRDNLRYFQFLGADLVAASFEHLDFDERGQPDFSNFFKGYIQPNILDSSSPMGMCGYINAAIELQGQISAGLIPEPDYLYVPIGLLGTATGLMLGLKACGLKTQIIPVQIFSTQENTRKTINKQIIALFTQTSAYLHRIAPSFPALTLNETEFDLRVYSTHHADANLKEALEWIQRFNQMEIITLDATWTAPMLVALLHDLQENKLHDKVVLFWHTYNSRPYPDELAQVDYHHLPEPFWHYFEVEALSIVNKPA
jgi:1-aminocyclopropane-1-carboxylate deaminase/D-cysteine desulfhydrase-like pyridoxal-dependent ACC family enzyme